MNYKIRDGIVLKNICGEWLLIAVGEASEKCLYVRHINDSLAWYWQLLEKGMSENEIIHEAVLHYDAQENLIRHDVHELMIQMTDLGYLIADEI